MTYFFSGGQESQFEGETRLLFPSPKVLTYDMKPEMSAIPLTNGVLYHLDQGNVDAIIMNYANLDMVGHTGVLEAATKAVETIDRCLGMLLKGCADSGYKLMLTSDHGNAEKMLDEETGGPFTAHTTNPVPFLIVDRDVRLKAEGVLGDVAPTLLDYMGLPVNGLMTGTSLIEK